MSGWKVQGKVNRLLARLEENSREAYLWKILTGSVILEKIFQTYALSLDI